MQGNGVTTVFDIPFVIDSVSDIALIYTNSSGAQTTVPASQYLIAINLPPTGGLWGIGGTCTYPLAGSPIAIGTSLTIQRILPLQQLTDLQDEGNFYPSAVEVGLDELEMQIQQVSSRTGQIRGTWLTGTSYNFGDIVVDGINGNDTGNLYACAIPNVSGTWTTDLAAGDWSLALNVQGIVNSLPQIGNNQVFANISGGTAIPTGVGVSALIDSALGNTQGDLLYRNNSAWTVLPPGTNGQVLQTQGTSANPKWTTTGGVTAVTAGTGLTGGGSGGAVTVSLAPIADQSFLANASGGTAAPGATTLSAFLDEVLGSTQGNIIYRGGTVWQALAPGTNGQVLKTGGPSANPSWGTSSASGGLLNVQVFASSGTYTPTSGTNAIIVYGIGGGGGGAGSGSSGAGGGGSGGATSLGTLLSLGGGGAGNAGNGTSSGGGGGIGGAVTTATYGVRGAAGGVGSPPTAGWLSSGPTGAPGMFGGGSGLGAQNNSGQAAAANSGAGGAGASGVSGITNPGGSGGAGAFGMTYATGITGTYTVTIGAAGTAGTAGASGFAGGAGGTGELIIFEYS